MHNVCFRCLNSNETSAKGSDATSNTTVLMSSERELIAHENMEDSLKNNVDVSGQKLISDKNIIKDFWKNDMDIEVLAGKKINMIHKIILIT